VTTDLDTLITALYVKIDDDLAGIRRVGRPPRLTDSELVCLAVAQALLGFASESHWLRAARRQLGHLFPYLPKQPGHGRRDLAQQQDRPADHPVTDRLRPLTGIGIGRLASRCVDVRGPTARPQPEP
jgi:hypothetical protein